MPAAVERFLSAAGDPLGTARAAWDDTAWRTWIIYAALIFGLNACFYWAGAGGATAATVFAAGEPAWTVGGGVWTVMTCSLLLIARVLTLRPLEPRLTDVSNMTVFLGLATIITYELALSFEPAVLEDLGDRYIYWPWILIHGGSVLLMRLLAPVAARPLVVWLLAYTFFSIVVETVVCAVTGVDSIEVTRFFIGLHALSMLGALAIAARGFGGHVARPLHVAVMLSLTFLFWIEVAAEYGGFAPDLGDPPICYQWLLILVAAASLSVLAAPYISRRLGAPERD